MNLSDDTSPIYANEAETVVFRMKDFKQVIEGHAHLPISELILMDKHHYPEWLAEQPEMQPERAWFFQVTFQTSEGDKGAEVIVGTKDNTLHVYRQIRPVLKIFKEKDRERSKEGIPDLTFDYIAQLEKAGEMAWLLWKEVFDTLHNVPHMRLTDVETEFQKVLDYFYREFEKVGFLLSDSDLSEDSHENDS